MNAHLKRTISIAALVVVAATSFGETTTSPGTIASDKASSAAQMRQELESIYKTSAPKVVTAHRGEFTQRLEPLMVRQVDYLISTMKPWAGAPGALSMTKSNSGEHDIRPNAHTIFALGVMYRLMPDEHFARDQKERWREKAIALSRFILPTHRAGGMKTNNGKQWYDQWQSAHWAHTAGRGLWLLWDELDEETRWLTARMICDEADRFINKPEPYQVAIDTKAEENAWNSTVISLAYCMFPNHPNSEAWRETAIRWAVSSFARKADLDSTRTLDGKPLKEWIKGANIHDDYTLENHHRVHPDYMNTVHLLLNQINLYEWAGKKPPEALYFNTAQVYAILKKLMLPDGGYIYPNGQDWQLHRNVHWVEPHFTQAVLNNDRQSATIARWCLEAGEKMLARTKDGGVFLPEEFSFPSTQHYTLEGFAESYIIGRAKGDGAEPLTDEELLKQQAGLHMFETGKFAIQRTTTSISSFSWGQQVMGLVMPLQKDVLLAPNERSLIGMVKIRGVKKETPRVKDVKTSTSEGTLFVAAVLDRGKGSLEQRLGFVAFPDGRTIYVDSVVGTSMTVAEQLDFGTLSVLNDPNWIYYDGTRTVGLNNNYTTFTSSGPAEPEPTVYEATKVTEQARLFDLDGKMQIQSYGSLRQAYHPNHKMVNGRLEQLFHLNSLPLSTDLDREIFPTKAVTYTILVFHPGKNQRRYASWVSRDEIRFTDKTVLSIDLQNLSLSHRKLSGEHRAIRTPFP